MLCFACLIKNLKYDHDQLTVTHECQVFFDYLLDKTRESKSNYLKYNKEDFHMSQLLW